MDLTLLFSPIDESIYSDIVDSGSLVNSIRLYGEKMPEYNDAHIAIVGLTEARGSHNNEGCKYGADEIRKKLYRLKRGAGWYNIIDLGNLKEGIDLEETHTRVSEVCRMLLEKNVIPLLIGGTHDLDYGQYRGYESMDKLIHFVNVDAFLDMDESDAPFASKHIHTILLHEPNYLLGYTHLAHQSYLIEPSNMELLEKLYFEAYRVGHLREDIKQIEPSIRNADMISFDITAIKSVEAPGNANAQPFGLTGEEACQLCWYAGLNNKLSSIGFYEYNPEEDDNHKKTALVVATMIWYFIEGHCQRKAKKKTNLMHNDFTKYMVSMSTEPDTLVFYKSKSTDKWWMEVSHLHANDKHTRPSIVPCSYSDYEMAVNGDVPERYVLTLAKLL